MSNELDRKVTDLAQWYLEHQRDAQDADKCMQFLKRAFSCQLEINLILLREISDLSNDNRILIKRLKDEGR